MFKTSTTEDYRRRVERAVVHITAHLDEPLDLARLAEVACFSPYHFHRIYRYLMGETPAETLRRLRLHRASGDLLHTKRPLTEIAKRSGYGSVVAFARAFAAAYGMPPAAYRRRGRLVAPLPPTHDEEWTMYSVEIQDLPTLKIAMIRHTGPYMEIGQAFERLMIWAGGRGLIGPETRGFGIFHDDPAETAAEALRSAASITVGPDVGPDAVSGVEIGEIPGGRHAVALHKGPYAELESAYGWLYREWLPGSGEDPADRPCVEEYLNTPRDVPPAELLTRIYLPLNAKAAAA